MQYPRDTYEIFAQSAEARSFALGAVSSNACSNFNLNNDFSETKFNFKSNASDHSALRCARFLDQQPPK